MLHNHISHYCHMQRVDHFHTPAPCVRLQGALVQSLVFSRACGWDAVVEGSPWLRACFDVLRVAHVHACVSLGV